jgi:signal transduction histidine kinase
VLNAFLQFARAGELHLEQGSLNAIVSDYVGFLEPQANSIEVELRPHLDTNLPVVMLDKSLMRQALVNLCRNAIEAMPEGGSIDLLTRTRGDQVVLEIIDGRENSQPDVSGLLLNAVRREWSGTSNRAQNCRSTSWPDLL